MKSKIKKVAIFVDGVFIPSFSGAANRFHYLTKTLQEHTNTEMIVILCDRGWSDIKQVKKESFKTYFVHPILYKNINFLTEILKKENVDIIQFANLELAIEIGIQLSNNLNRHLVFEAHYEDGEFAKSVGASKSVLENIEFLQNTFGKCFDKIIALSNEDHNLSKNLKVKTSNIAVIPSGVNLKDFPKNCFSLFSKKIIFFGNLFFEVNIEAMREIKKMIYKELESTGFIFYMIGDISETVKKAIEDKNFIVTGRQNNLFEKFSKTTFALAPVLQGTGIRIKILNYLNAGIPVITTTQGAKGFKRKDLLIIEDDLTKYPKLIDELVKNRKKLINLSRVSRKFVRENMSWQKISELVSMEYDNLLKKPVVPKGHAVGKVLKLKFNDPPWIKEMIDKKRFQKNTPFVGIGGYVIIGGNEKNHSSRGVAVCR